MKFEQYTAFAAEQWKSTMGSSEHFSLEKCSDEEKIKVWDKMADTYDLALGSDPRRVHSALSRLRALGALGAGKTALDIGSGTGAYALALAEHCERVYALDSSPGMRQVMLSKAREKGICNVTALDADWKRVGLSELPTKLDLVLSSLNTGINDYDSLVKMNEVSCGFCCYIAPYGTAKHSRRRAFQEIVFGRTLNAAGGNDIIHAFNIIYGLGYQPELTYAASEWTRADAPEEALSAVCREYGRYMSIDEKLRARLEEYIRANLNEAGLFEQTQSSQLGIMIWDTRTR